MGLFDKFKKNDSDAPDFNFKYLEKIINSGEKVIQLENDIFIDSKESRKYSRGINIKTDGVVIDGNNHTIDAKGKSSIFNIKAKNIVIKNLNFKNAHVNADGGAIYVDNGSNVQFISSKFIANKTGGYGGAIFTQKGCSLEIDSCEFLENSAGKAGGAITSQGELNLKDTTLKSNNADNFGAIYSLADLEILSSKFIGNESNLVGVIAVVGGELRIDDSSFEDNFSASGAILSIRDIKADIENSTFKNNRCRVGMITNEGSLNIKNCKFKDNKADTNAGTIANLKELTIKDSYFENNQSNIGGAIISAENSTLAISSSKFKDNSAEEHAGAVASMGHLNIYSTEFVGNSSPDSGAIYIDVKSESVISDSVFEDNRSVGDGSAINFQGKHLMIENTKFRKNVVKIIGGTIYAPNINDVEISEDCIFEDNEPDVMVVDNDMITEEYGLDKIEDIAKQIDDNNL